MSYMKEALDDLDLDAPEPMQPIRFEYLTTTRDIAIQTDMLERLGLVHTFVGRQLYALNECDGNACRMAAIELLLDQGIEPTEQLIADGCAQLLTKVVLETAGTVAHSALRRPSLAVDRLAQDLRAEADEILARRGVEIRANVLSRIAEIEAA